LSITARITVQFGLVRKSVLSPASGLILAVLLASCTTPPPPIPYPGRVVGHRVVSSEERRAFSAELAPSPDSHPRIRFTDLRLLTIREVPVHEKMLEYRIGDSTDRSAVRHEVVPDEFIEGPEQIRNERRVAGPLAGRDLTLNGRPIRTGADGVFVDEAGYILSLFDVPFRRDVLLTFHCAGRADVALRVTRAALLASLGIDPTVGKAGPRGALRFRVELPQSIATGGVMVVRVTAENREATPVWGVEGRLFSRVPWLGGKSFYFGRIDPGSSRVFERRIHVPSAVPAGTYYALLAFMDWLGPNTGRNVPITLRVLPAGADRSAAP